MLAVLPGGRGNDFARKLGIGARPGRRLHADRRRPRAPRRRRRGRRALLPRDPLGRAGLRRAGHRQRHPAAARQPRLPLRHAARPARLARGGLEVTVDGERHAVHRLLGRRGELRRLRRRHVARPGRLARRRPARRRALRAPPTPRSCSTLGRVFKGTHVDEPGFHVLRGAQVTFSADRPFMAYADGDPIAELPTTVCVRPGALRVLRRERQARRRAARRPRRRRASRAAPAAAARRCPARSSRAWSRTPSAQLAAPPGARIGGDLGHQRQDDDRRDGRGDHARAPARRSCTTARARTWPAASPRRSPAPPRRGGRELDGDLGLFEVDEFWLGPVVEELGPRAMLLSNLFRDQLDRYGELETIADRWAEIVAARDPATTLVLNADDPLDRRPRPRPACRRLLRRRRRLRSRCPSSSTPSDSKHCRRCGHAYVYDAAYLAHLGHYRCPNCGQRRPAPVVRATDVELRRHPRRARSRCTRRPASGASSCRCPASTTSTTRSAPPR